MKTLANGAVVPADTPSVAAAKRAHQNAGGDINPSSHSPASINPSSYRHASIHQPQHVPQMKTLSNGAVVPVDTPSVAAAKRAHQNAGGAINPSSHSPASINPSSYRHASIHQPQHVPQMKTLSNGAVVPVDTPSVAAAKRAHQ